MLDFVGRPLRLITLEDLQAYQASLADLKVATQSRKLVSVKSLFNFAHKTGYLPLNVSAALFLPKRANDLAERIMLEEDVLIMIRLETNPRNKAILKLLYMGALRISELCALKVRNCQQRGDTGQLTIFGKGGKTRPVLLKQSMWEALAPFIEGKQPDDPVFTAGRTGQGAKGRALGRRMVDAIIKKAAARAGLSATIAAHHFRHSAASPALDNGATVTLVRDMLGHASLDTTSKYSHARPDQSASNFLKG